MKRFSRDFIGYAAFPLLLLALFAVLIVLYHLFDLPSYQAIADWAKNSFARYGYWMVFVAAMAEGILFFNWYLPGSVVVVMGAVFAQQYGMSVIGVVSVITLGFWLTSVLNYALGRYGWYRVLLRFGLRDAIEKTKRRVERHGLKIIFGTYFHPNIGALTATCAGILRLPFYRFLYYSTLALVAWNALWGGVVYFSGPIILNLLSFQVLLGVLGFWLVILLVQFIRSRGRVAIPEIDSNSRAHHS